MTASGCTEDVLRRLARLYRRRFFRRRIDLTCQMLVDSVGLAVCGHKPSLPVLYLWGIHEKGELDERDKRGFQFLDALLEHVRATLGVDVHPELLIADTHAKLNGVAPDRAESYLRQVECLAASHRWHTGRFSALLNEHPPNEVRHPDDSFITNQQWAILVKAAARLSTSELSPAQAARNYVRERLRENPIISKRFSGYVLFSCSDCRLEFLQPALPVLWTWCSNRRSRSKPWFPKGRE